MKLLSIVVCLLLIVGCSVQSSQLSAVMALVNKPSSDESLNSWSVKYANYTAIVYPVLLPKGILFSNSAGDEILFDGWSVRQVKGLGLRGLAYQNSDAGSQRTFMRGSRSLAVHKCDQWLLRQQSGKKQFSQSCEGVSIYINRILVEEDGDISVIQQIVDDKYQPIILTRLN